MDSTQAYGRLSAGTSIIAIGAIHQLFGLAAGVGWLAGPDGSRHSPLVDLLRAGFVGQADGDPIRMAIVWFLLFGFMMMFSGLLLYRLERSGATLTRGLALSFGALCTLGVVLMPASGFWLGFIPTVQMLRRAA